MAGPSVKPMIVWMNSSTEADTARIRTVAIDWATANEGPKNIDANTNINENVIGTDEREIRRQVREELHRHHHEACDARHPHVPALVVRSPC